MPKSLNHCQFIGNLGKDVEIKYTPSGTAVASFSLACNERYKDKNGEYQDRVEWINVKCWQRTAEIAAEYLKKGSQCYVSGRLHTDSWDDKESGQKKYRTEVVVNELILLGGKGGGNGQRRGGSEEDYSQEPEPRHKAPAQAVAEQMKPVIDDSDIPF